jgi:transcriptional regulator with XRE-family HTH domain
MDDNTLSNEATELKSLREAAGLDMAQLASLANLSLGQVRQLEEGGDSNFYSPQIKSQSMRRVLRLLQNQNSTEDAAAQASIEQVPKSVNVIDDIIRLSEKNLKNTIDTSLVRRPGNPYKALLTVGAGLLVVFGLLHWQSNQSESQQTFAEWVEPFSAQPAQASSEAVEKVAPVLAQVESPPPSPALPPAPVVSPALPVAVAAKDQALNDCKIFQEEPTPAAPVSINKAGNYVYLLASKNVQVCVDDGKRMLNVVNLKAGEGKTVRGSSPWVISAVDLASVQVYFQGAKVFVPPNAGQRILLKEQAVSVDVRNLPQ